MVKTVMETRREELLIRYLAGERMTAASVAKETGMAAHTAEGDMQWVREQYSVLVLDRMKAKVLELLDAAVELSEPMAMDTKELLKMIAYISPPVQKVEADVKADLKIEWSPTKPSGE